MFNFDVVRIIIDGPHSASFNMAADLWLMEQCSIKPAMFLRIYQWEQPSITLGYMQDPVKILTDSVYHSKDISWIRRPTGGRAVLHQGDVTYSCIFPTSNKVMGATIAESYGIIARCLRVGLLSISIDCSQHDSSPSGSDGRRDIKLPCFLAPNRNEIMVNNKKLVGSAQKRTDTAVLQHGSIPVTPAFRNLPDYQNLSDDERATQRQQLVDKCICLHEINPSLSYSHISQALAQGFADTLAVPAIFKMWSHQEYTIISEVAENVEFADKWLT